MRNPEKYLLEILNKYPQLRPVASWERGRIVPCPDCGGTNVSKWPVDPNDPGDDGTCTLCQGEPYELRGSWTNAWQVWFGHIGSHTVVISVFSGEEDFFPHPLWFSIEVCPNLWVLPEGEVSIEFQEGLKASNHASSGSWNGEDSGSGVQRIPDSLRGFMYLTYRSDDDFHVHILPPDIIQFLIDNPRQ